MRGRMITVTAIAIGAAALAFARGGSARAPSWQGTLLVQLAVDDLDRSIAFYTETLGFELESRNDDLAWARIKPGIGGVTIGLGAQPAVGGSGTASLNFGVADIDSARSLLESRGVVFDGPTITAPGVVRLADFSDPDGNRIRLAEDIKP